MERLKIAITGATGFVGANLIEYFAAKGHDIHILSRVLGRKAGANWRLQQVPKDRITILDCDIRDLSKTRKAMRASKPDVLIHCATYGAYPFETDVRRIIDTNAIGSINLLDAAKDVQIIINTGSSSEYGTRWSPMKETDPLAPSTDYAISKALISNLVAKQKSAITLRLFSVYGYYEEKYRLIPTLLYSVIKRRKAHLSRNPNRKDYVFVDDVSKAYELAIKGYDDNVGEIFNIGCGKQTRTVDLVGLLKVDATWKESAPPVDDKRVWQADTSKSRERLKWKPNYTLREGLQRTQRWMERNIDMYDDDMNDKAKLL